MIGTARGLAILAAIAAALAVVLLVAGPRSSAPVDRSLVPGLDTSHVTELAFTRGSQTVRITRTGTQWRWQQPPGLADPTTIDAVLTALRGGRWHRRAEAKVAGTPRARLAVDGTLLGIGAPLAGTEQTWLVRGDDALLVDTWVANALAPEPLALRLRHPLDCTSAKDIVATSANDKLHVAGTRLVEPRAFWLDERVLESIYEACATIEIVSLETGQRAAAPGLQVRTDGGGWLTQLGVCDGGRILVDTSAGEGCIDAAALQNLDAALHAVVASLYAPIDLRPLPIVPAALTLRDGAVLDLSSRPRIGDVEADAERVHELVAALSARGESAIPLPAAKPTGSITAVDRAGTQVVLDLYDRAVARRGEQGAIQVSVATWTTITRPTSSLRDPTRWREDPTTISSITLDNVTYTRGAVLGEWTREPAGKVDPHLVDALAEALATVRAPAGPPPKAVAHRLRVTITPPAGSSITHALELGAPSEAGCAGRVDGTAVVLPLPLCTAAIALAAQR